MNKIIDLYIIVYIIIKSVVDIIIINYGIIIIPYYRIGTIITTDYNNIYSLWITIIIIDLVIYEHYRWSDLNNNIIFIK